jgi:hypothetical protein
MYLNSMFITETQLKNYAPFSKVSALAESLIEKKKATARPKVFLSHSHKDKDIVGHAVRFLKSHGVDVYVDWLDDGMPGRVSGQTALILKAKIKEHEKFVLLATNNSADSKWIPWELGIADGERTLENIASLPVANDNREFRGSEYIQIYPRIQNINNAWWVYLADAICVKLSDWLSARK